MSKKLKRNEQINEISDHAKSLIAKGNSRHVVIRDASGSKMAEFSMTVAVIGGVLLFFLPWSWFIIAGAAVYGMAKKIRVEFVRDILNEDEIKLDMDN
jgi:hypothetical protein